MKRRLEKTTLKLKFFELRRRIEFWQTKTGLPVISKLTYNIGRSSNFMSKANDCFKF